MLIRRLVPSPSSLSPPLSPPPPLLPSFPLFLFLKGIEKFAAERNILLIDEAVVKKSREEMIEKRGAMFPFLKKFINSEKS